MVFSLPNHAIASVFSTLTVVLSFVIIQTGYISNIETLSKTSNLMFTLIFFASYLLYFSNKSMQKTLYNGLYFLGSLSVAFAISTQFVGMFFLAEGQQTICFLVYYF